MQRYVLQTSPNSRRYKSEPESTLKLSISERVKSVFRRLIARLNGTLDNDLDHMPLQTTIQERRRASARYSVGASTAVLGAAAVSRPVTKYRTNESDLLGNTARYSVESSGQPIFYFSEQGTPGSRSLRPLAPIDENGDDSEEQVDELIRLIDLRIDERMWSLERTLSRYYLDGFRLRHYSSIPMQDEKLEEALPPHMSRSTHYAQSQPLDHPGPQQTLLMQPVGPSVSSPYDASLAYLIPHQVQPSLPGPTQSPSYPSRPSYPPRPPVEQQHWQVVDPRVEVTRTTSDNPITSTEATTTNSQTNLLEPGFPARRDMRGTIRRAVERLQQEWPHDAHDHQLYVPSTQYVPRSRSTSPSDSPPRYN